MDSINRIDTSLGNRKHPRHRVEDSSFAVSINHGTSSYFVGQVVDISIDGLSFVYMKNVDLPDQTETISVFSTEWGYWFEEVAAKQIAECEIAENGFFSRISMIKRGIQFGLLPEEKVLGLKRIIENIQTKQIKNHGYKNIVENKIHWSEQSYVLTKKSRFLNENLSQKNGSPKVSSMEI